MSEELIKLIQERSENEIISQYICDSINYFKARNQQYVEKLCDSIKLLLDEKALLFKISDDGSRFYKDNQLTCVYIGRKSITRKDFTTFIHEITHAIHILLYAMMIPTEYEETRKRITSDAEFSDKMHILFRYIIESKKKFIELIKRISATHYSGFSKYNNVASIVSNNNNITNKISNINNIIDIIDDADIDFSKIISTSRRLNQQFESLIDDIGYGYSAVEQQFHVLSSIEGLLDSLLLGQLYEGYSSNNCYLRGFGHTKNYFMQDSENSYIELLAEYSVLVAYNDAELLEKIKEILGEEMYNILDSSLNSMFVDNSIDDKSVSHKC